MKKALLGPSVAERFWSKVDKTEGCWNWTATKVGAGYGHFTQGGVTKMILAHRWSYEVLVGEIPDGLVIDHLCMNKACVNPAHLEPVTQAVNIARNPNAVNKRNALVTQCPQGHEYTEENTRIHKGKRNCRSCSRVHTANYRARQMASA